VGEDLVKLAEDKACKLAVNQNGRWAPHKAWMREAVRAGLIGDVISAHVSLHWNHGWTAGTPFDEIEDLVLYDFGVHWFDFIASLTGRRAQSVFASASHASGQANKVPLWRRRWCGSTAGRRASSSTAARRTDPATRPMWPGPREAFRRMARTSARRRSR
jgi:predicted dehydrogenase